MAIKISGTTVVDDSRNVVNIQNLSSSGVSTIGNLRVSAGIVSAATGIITYYGDGQYLSNISAVGAGGSLTIGRRVGAAVISVGAGGTTLLKRNGTLVTINI